jgi:MinD-like ATPase involved in chromosome partitioning or flagellar assembly
VAAKQKEILVVTRVAGLVDALQGYEGVRMTSAQRLEFASRLLTSEQPPEALYLEDSCGTVAELWDIVRAAQGHRIPILVATHGPAVAAQADLIAAGLAVTEERQPAQVAAWIASQLGLRARAAASGQVTIAVAGAKGGIGKSLVVQVIAEGIAMRGGRVLVVDGDISNSGVRPTFHIPSGAKTYVTLREDGARAWEPDNVRSRITAHSESGLHFLLAGEDSTLGQDLYVTDWQNFMSAVRSLDEFDVVVLDTGPELLKRPYALDAANNGGLVIFPTPPGSKERTGVGNALRLFSTYNLLDRCALLYMEPEKGVTVGVKDIAPRFRAAFPTIREIGTLPRSPRQVSLAAEADRYLSPLRIEPHSRFTRQAHALVDAICTVARVTLPAPMPRSSLLGRIGAGWRGHRNAIPAPTMGIF